MRTLELLAPARNIEIGIAAIDCGADAVYIAGPAFGARQAAGNSIEDISRLCDYAHKFGARIFLTLNTILYDEELREAEDLMQKAEQAGVDAIIVQDLAIMKMADGGTDGKTLEIPLHASTQCAIRDVDKAMFYRQAGFSRLVLERELPLETVRKISESTGCEIEFSYTAHSAYVTADNAICPNIFPEEAQTGANASRPAGHFTTLLTTAGRCSSATRPCCPSRTTTCCTASKTSPMQVWTLSRSRAGSRTFHT